MKSAFKRGFVKMNKVPARRHAYYLMPKGCSVGALRISRYIDNSLSFYRRLKVECLAMFSTLSTNGIEEVTLIDDVDIADVAILASFDRSIEVTAMVCTKTSNENIGTTQIISNIDSNQNRVMVKCDSGTPQACYDGMASVFDDCRILYPDAFHIHKDNHPE